MSETKSASITNDGGVDRSVLDTIPATVEAVLGVAQVTLGDLTCLSKGDCFTLDSRLGDPVELRINGTAIAFGEIVSVGENFGIRIQAIVRT